VGVPEVWPLKLMERAEQLDGLLLGQLLEVKEPADRDVSNDLTLC